MKTLLLSFGCLLALSLPALSQDLGGGDGMTSFTTADYDPASNTVTAYSETDLDYNSLPYYYPGVSLSVVDQNGSYNYTWNCTYSGDGETYQGESCDWTGSSGYTYTATGRHWAELIVKVQSTPCYDPPCGAPPPTEYLDEADFEYYSGLGLDDPYGDVYMDNYAPVDSTSETETVGETYDSATVGPLPTCGDVRTNIINDYSVYFAAFHPACSDFTNATGWSAISIFPYSTMVQSETPSYQAYAILQPYMSTDLVGVQSTYKSSLTITSGYRDPQAEKKQAKYYPNSRHMAGDAVDLATGNNSNTWSNLQKAGHANKACVEPADYQGSKTTPNYNHAHLDWRTLGTGNFPGPKSCPPKW